MTNRPIWQAYNDTGALEVSCPHCGAQPGHWCTRDDGNVRRIACVDRATSGFAAGNGKFYARDFTQPSHPPTEEPPRPHSQSPTTRMKTPQ